MSQQKRIIDKLVQLSAENKRLTKSILLHISITEENDQLIQDELKKLDSILSKPYNSNDKINSKN